MSPRKKASDAPEAAPSAAAKGFSRAQRWIAIAAIVLVVTGGACYAVWQQVREHVLTSSQYLVSTEQITITPLPAWIHTDVKAEVIREASSGGPLSLLDPELTVRMAAAFSEHPWVSRVERVSKRYPAGLEAMLAYRKPVAMVEVQNGAGALPVDVDGVVLPTRDFTAAEVDAYPRISEIHTTPTGTVGMHWGDPCVVGGARLAAALAEDWKPLGLFRVVPLERRAGRSGPEYTFGIVTHSGTIILWGSAPGNEVGGEVPAAEKLAQLKKYAGQNNGSLDDPEGQPHIVEISKNGALLSKPRPAIKPLPKSEAEAAMLDERP